jgi:hypothetical protein
MSLIRLISILEDHSIQYYIVNTNGIVKVMALEYDDIYTDVTKYSIKKLAMWLGY